MTNQDRTKEIERKLALLEQMDKVQPFSGTNPYLSLNLFQKEFKDWAEFFGWEEGDKFFILKRKLEGKAREIFEIHEESIKNSKDLFNLLQDRLAPKTNANEKLQELWNFRQSPEMPVADFVSLARKKAKLAAQSHACTSDKIEQATEEWLLNALKNNVLPQYRREILRKNPKTSKEFLEIAETEEATWKETNNLNIQLNENISCNAVISQNNSDDLITLMQEMTNKIKDLSAKVENLEKTKNSPNSTPQNVLICRQCGRRGHGFRECRSRMQNFFPNPRFPPPNYFPDSRYPPPNFFPNPSSSYVPDFNYQPRGYIPRPNPRAEFQGPNNSQQPGEQQSQQNSNTADNNRGGYRDNRRGRFPRQPRDNSNRTLNE